MAQHIEESAAPTDSLVSFRNSSTRKLAVLGNGAIADANLVNRVIANPTAKTIVDGSATSLADVDCQSGTTSGGMIFYHVQASDGTDFQAMSGMVAYACVNKAGTLTLTITDVTANNAKAVSAGTLTLAWTFVSGTSKGTIKLQPTGSLTETTPYNVTYTVFPLIGAVTVL